MTLQSRRKHRITVPKFPAKNRTSRNRWKAIALEGAAWLSGIVTAAIPAADLLNADEPARAPGIFRVADDAIPIESASQRVTKPKPRAVVKQTSAEWVESSPAAPVRPSSTEWKLRWRTPNVVSRSSPVEEQPLAVSRAVSWDPANSAQAFNRSMVRTVAQQTPVDPFEEAAPAPNPTLQNRNLQTPGTPNQPAQLQPGPNQPTVPPNRTRPDLNDPFSDPADSPAQPKAAPADQPRPMPSELPVPQDPATPMPERDLAPAPPPGMTPDLPLGPIRDSVPCDRVYNDRNCCADDAVCLKARQFVGTYKINQIPLDITPGFTNTDAASGAVIPTEVKKEQELAKAPTRIWKDRAGTTVAEGRFADYHNGLIHVLGADGQTAKVPFNTLSDDDVCFVTAWWSLPTECSMVDQEYKPRQWLASTLTWKASALCHKPLYFEEVALERYGHSVGPIKQPFVSGAHFFGSLVTLPYNMGIHPPQECQYALGYYRPGSCAPWLVPPLPVSLRGALAEAGAVVGGIYIIP